MQELSCLIGNYGVNVFGAFHEIRSLIEELKPVSFKPVSAFRALYGNASQSDPSLAVWPSFCLILRQNA